MVVRGQSDGKSVGINIGGDGGNDGVIWECFMVVVSAVMVEMVESDIPSIRTLKISRTLPALLLNFAHKKLTITFNFVY